MAITFKSTISDILIKIVSSKGSGPILTAGSSNGSCDSCHITSEEYIQNLRPLFNLNNNDRIDFSRVLINNLWNAYYYELIDGFSKIYYNGELFKTTAAANSESKITARTNYYFTKLFKINNLLYGAGLIDRLSDGYLTSNPAYNITKNDARRALWYLISRASIKEIEAFSVYYSKTSDKTAALKMLMEESDAAFGPVKNNNINKITLDKLKFYYNDISESSGGQKRREAEYKYYIISEYIDDHYMNWAITNERTDENSLLYDALKCRFESVFERQIKNDAFIDKLESGGDNKSCAGNIGKNLNNSENGVYYKLNKNNLLKKAETCFNSISYTDFNDYFSDFNNIMKNFYKIIELKSRSETVFIKYKDGVSFELFKNSLAFIKSKAVYNYVDWCSDELNSAECGINDKFLPDMIYKCFEDIKDRASDLLIKEISRWADENIINAQILDKNIKTQNRFITFDDCLNFKEEIISDDKLKALSEKFHSLHIVFICRINDKNKTVRELYRLISPTCDIVNNRMIFHSDFAPLEIPYAKGVILNDKIFEYDGFNTWYGGKDKIHRSQLANPYSTSLIKRMAEDIISILS